MGYACFFGYTTKVKMVANVDFIFQALKSCTIDDARTDQTVSASGSRNDSSRE